MPYNFEMRLNNAMKKLNKLGSDEGIDARQAKRRAMAKQESAQLDKNIVAAVGNLKSKPKVQAPDTKPAGQKTVDPSAWDNQNLSPKVTGEANWSSPKDTSIGTVGYAAEQAKRNKQNNDMAYMTPLGGESTTPGKMKEQEQGTLGYQDQKTAQSIQQGAGMLGSNVNTGPEMPPPRPQYGLPDPNGPYFGGMPDPRGRY